MGNYIKCVIHCQVNYPTYIYFFVPKMPSDLHSFSLKLPIQISLIIIVLFLQAQRAYSVVFLVFREFRAPCCYHLFKTPALADSVVMVINCEIHPGSGCVCALQPPGKFTLHSDPGIRLSFQVRVCRGAEPLALSHRRLWQ